MKHSKKIVSVVVILGMTLLAYFIFSKDTFELGKKTIKVSNSKKYLLADGESYIHLDKDNVIVRIGDKHDPNVLILGL